MSFFDRFFGRTELHQRPDALMANIALEGGDPYSLQVLFAGPLAVDEAALTAALRAFSPETAEAQAELVACEPTDSKDPDLLGLAGWGSHVVKLVGANKPMRPEPPDTHDPVEWCLGPAHFEPHFKDAARAHKSFIILYYAGTADDPVERYVALAAVAAALVPATALVVLNEDGRSAFPAAALVPESGDGIEMLRSLPLPLLYCGFIKLEIENVLGVWMRTVGAERLGLPDLAFHADGHHRGQETFELFTSLLGYLRRRGARFADGHTIGIDENATMRLRVRFEDEDFLGSPGEMFVVEPA
jgi:hypothetical protein